MKAVSLTNRQNRKHSPAEEIRINGGFLFALSFASAMFGTNSIFSNDLFCVVRDKF